MWSFCDLLAGLQRKVRYIEYLFHHSTTCHPVTFTVFIVITIVTKIARVTSVFIFCVVKIRDQLGHYYTMTDLRVSLSEPQSEPIGDSKHRLLLSQTVRQTEGSIDREMSYKSFETIEIGGIFFKIIIKHLVYNMSLCV